MKIEEVTFLPGPWRIGKEIGRTLYIDDRCVGMVDSFSLAEEIVATMNGAYRGDTPAGRYAERMACASIAEAEARRINSRPSEDPSQLTAIRIANMIRGRAVGT